MAGIDMAEHGGGQLFSVYEVEATGELPAECRVILDPDLTSVYWPLEEGDAAGDSKFGTTRNTRHRWNGSSS